MTRKAGCTKRAAAAAPTADDRGQDDRRLDDRGLIDRATSAGLDGERVGLQAEGMRAARRHRWLCAVLLAPVAILAVSASSFSALRCTMSGLLVPETCCPAAADGAPAPRAPAQPAVQQASCCERIVVPNAKAPAVAADQAQELPPARAVVALAARAPTEHFAAAEWTRHGSMVRPPPGRSAPAFLLTHAFLI